MVVTATIGVRFNPVGVDAFSARYPGWALRANLGLVDLILLGFVAITRRQAFPLCARHSSSPMDSYSPQRNVARHELPWEPVPKHAPTLKGLNPSANL